MTRIPNTVSPLAPGADSGGATAPVRFSWSDPQQRNPLIALVAGSLVLVWSYWMMFLDTAEYWSQPQYSHGWIIPLIALYLMWNRRPAPEAVDNDPVMRFMPPVLGGAAVAAGACYFGFGLPTLAGVILALGCAAALAFTLWGQPFATPVDKNDSTYYNRLDVMWGVVGAGCALLVAGVFLPEFPVLRGEGLSMLGLMTLVVGIPAVGMTTDPVAKISRSENAAGLLVILAATAGWAFGAHYDMMPLARYCFVASVLGLFLMLGGLRLIKWAGPAAAFLAFMFPLPAKVETSVLMNLQKVAAAGSEVAFTTIGVRAIRQGAQITLLGIENEDIQMEIAEACSGLSMSTILVAMVVGMVLIIDRPWWDKLVVLLSALPIALVSNVFRIVVTGLLWMAIDQTLTVSEEQVLDIRHQVHDYAGLLLMMPFALGLLLLELKILSSLTVPEESQLDQSTVVGRGGVPVR